MFLPNIARYGTRSVDFFLANFNKLKTDFQKVEGLESSIYMNFWLSKSGMFVNLGNRLEYGGHAVIVTTSFRLFICNNMTEVCL